MSVALYNTGGLRFWCDKEIKLREQCISLFADTVCNNLKDLNFAWEFHRIEAPALTPRSLMPAYDESDVFVTEHTAGGEQLAMRAETTPGSYAWAKFALNNTQLPICIWQAGKSYRREQNDGASAAKLRFNEFWQQEFQCIYKKDTKADYRAAIIDEVAHAIHLATHCEVRIVESDRLPLYSESTWDIEAKHGDAWREMASISIRNDFSDETKVLEVAIGLDRVVTLAYEAATNTPEYLKELDNGDA